MYIHSTVVLQFTCSSDECSLEKAPHKSAFTILQCGTYL